VIDSAYDLSYTFWHNVRSGVLRYVRTYLVVSILSLFVLLYLFVVASSALFLLADLCLLLFILTGVFPIIDVALYKPALKLVRYIIPERIIEKIEYED